MKCTQLILLWMGLVLFLPAKAQNLVQDSSFEAVTSHYCGIITQASQFNALFTYWDVPTDAEADQFSLQVDTTCFNHATNPSPSGPIPPKGSQAPRTGDVYTGIFLYTIPSLEQRDYLITELSSPMVMGASYAVSAWVSLADFSEYASPNLDFLLTTQSFYVANRTVLPLNPQTNHTDSLMSTTEWVLIKDTLVADSAYAFLTLGNFKNDASTIFYANPGSGGGPGQYGSYYYIDDVAVEQVETPVNISERMPEPVAQLPTTLSASRATAFKPRFPDGGTTQSFSIFNLNGQQIYAGQGQYASWDDFSSAVGIYIWNLEWLDSQGAMHQQQGKVLVFQ